MLATVTVASTMILFGISPVAGAQTVHESDTSSTYPNGSGVPVAGCSGFAPYGEIDMVFNWMPQDNYNAELDYSGASSGNDKFAFTPDANGNYDTSTDAFHALPEGQYQATLHWTNARTGVSSANGPFNLNVTGCPATGKMPPEGTVIKPVTAMARTTDGRGYWEVGADGSVQAFGDADFEGSLSGYHLNAPVVGIAPTIDGYGYWLVARDGGVFGFGDATFYGSTGNIRLAQPIVAMAATPDSKGYWFVAADGGIFAYGDAHFYGSTGGVKLAQPVVSMAATQDGRGYYLVAKDGGMFTYGDAVFHGSTGGVKLAKPVVGMATDPATGGYWLVAGDGGMFAFDAPFYGSTGNVHLAAPIVGMTNTPDGQGYRFVASDGGMFSYGDAGFYGSAA
jgi:hypothetical protein